MSKWMRLRRNKAKEDQVRLADARRKLAEARRREPRVNELTRKLRKHYEDNQFAARVFQHLAEGGR